MQLLICFYGVLRLLTTDKKVFCRLIDYQKGFDTLTFTEFYTM